MFDLGSENNEEENNLNEIKYNFMERPELNERELLSIEKEMLGIYISGHPLEKIREQIIASTNISSMQMKDIDEINSIGADGDKSDVRVEEVAKFTDGQEVRIAGIITSVKKKYTKKLNHQKMLVTLQNMLKFTLIMIAVAAMIEYFTTFIRRS